LSGLALVDNILGETSEAHLEDQADP
jgi:hypothetical protein